jgi:hypothetical protein
MKVECDELGSLIPCACFTALFQRLNYLVRVTGALTDWYMPAACNIHDEMQKLISKGH